VGGVLINRYQQLIAAIIAFVIATVGAWLLFKQIRVAQHQLAASRHEMLQQRRSGIQNAAYRTYRPCITTLLPENRIRVRGQAADPLLEPPEVDDESFRAAVALVALVEDEAQKLRQMLAVSHVSDSADRLTHTFVDSARQYIAACARWQRKTAQDRLRVG
jgi:hypothetical protein